MEVIAPTGVKIYNVSAGKTLPEWMEEKKKKSLKRNPGMLLSQLNISRLPYFMSMSTHFEDNIIFSIQNVIPTKRSVAGALDVFA
jgi:hypothetical protein